VSVGHPDRHGWADPAAITATGADSPAESARTAGSGGAAHGRPALAGEFKFS